MCYVKRVMQKTQFGGLIVAVVLCVCTIAGLNSTTMYAFTQAQNATSGKNTTVLGNMTGGNTASSSSCGTGSTASSCYDAGYQNALANPGKTCPSGIPTVGPYFLLTTQLHCRTVLVEVTMFR